MLKVQLHFFGGGGGGGGEGQRVRSVGGNEYSKFGDLSVYFIFSLL